MGRGSRSGGQLIVLAWCAFQPRTRALAEALDGEARFVTGFGRTRRTPLPFRYLRSALTTWRQLGREQPSLVVAISPPFLAPLVGLAWCRRRGGRLVIDCHTGAFHGRRWGWARPISRWLARQADLNTLHTESHRSEVEGWGARALLLPDDVPGPEEAMTPLASHGRPVVLVAGSMDDNEPVADVITAARQLPGVEFRFTGDPNRLPRELLDGAPPNAVFTGWLEYPKFLGELLVADIVGVFSDDPHIMNRAAFEAVGLGRALVLSDLPGLRDRFGEAALFSTNDPDAIARTLRDAFDRRLDLEGRSALLRSKLRAQRAEAMDHLGSLVAGGADPQVARHASAEAPASKRMLMVSQHPIDNPTLRRNIDYLLDEGWELDVFCAAKPGLDDAPWRSRLSLHALPPVRSPDGGGGTVAHRRSGMVWYPIEYVAFFLRALPRVTWRSLRRRYECVQVDNVPDFLVLTALPGRLRGARIVFFMYEVMPEMTRSLLHASARHPLVRIASWQERLATSLADGVVTVAEAGRRRLIERGVKPSKIVVVPNTQPRREERSGAMGKPANGGGPVQSAGGPVLITHGTLLRRYGVQIAIQAMPELRRRWPTVKLRVMGEGEYRPELARLAAELGLEDAVEFTGFVPWDHVMDQVRVATVGIVPVLADGYGELLLPNKLFEYVAQRVPAVCSRLPVIQEYFPPNSVAYFEQGNASELAEQVDRLLRDPDLRARQAQAACQAVEACSWERVSGDYLAALQPAAATR